MILFAKVNFEWFNKLVKSTNTNIKNKIVSRYLVDDAPKKKS